MTHPFLYIVTSKCLFLYPYARQTKSVSKYLLFATQYEILFGSFNRQLVNLLISRGTSVYLVSGGFRQLVEPVAREIGVPMENIFANRLLFDEEGQPKHYPDLWKDPVLRVMNGSIVQALVLFVQLWVLKSAQYPLTASALVWMCV